MLFSLAMCENRISQKKTERLGVDMYVYIVIIFDYSGTPAAMPLCDDHHECAFLQCNAVRSSRYTVLFDSAVRILQAFYLFTVKPPH